MLRNTPLSDRHVDVCSGLIEGLEIHRAEIHRRPILTTKTTAHPLTSVITAAFPLVHLNFPIPSPNRTMDPAVARGIPSSLNLLVSPLRRNRSFFLKIPPHTFIPHLSLLQTPWFSTPSIHTNRRAGIFLASARRHHEPRECLCLVSCAVSSKLVCALLRHRCGRV